MKYIIMCGGRYRKWAYPRQLWAINGEKIVSRTIRLLKECGVTDIAISTNDPRFDDLGVPLLEHENTYYAREYDDIDGYWCDAFYPTEDPVCYIFGDVVFSPAAIRTIVEANTEDIEFFASAWPFALEYMKSWAEPFALKVQNPKHLRESIELCKALDADGRFNRKPIMWELWQVIKDTPLNVIRKNYTVINDYTCDIDSVGDYYAFIKKIGPQISSEGSAL